MKSICFGYFIVYGDLPLPRILKILPLLFAVASLGILSFPVGATTLITFDEVVAGSTAFGFDGSGDGTDDVVFTTTDPSGFNTIGPGPNQSYIEEPGLEGTTLLRTDLKVNFVGGATEYLSFGFALNSAVANNSYAVEFEIYDDSDNLIARKSEIAEFTNTSFGVSSFPEGKIELTFSGVASYAKFNITSEFGRYIIDNFEGEFSASPDIVNEIKVFDNSPYDGKIKTRGLPGIEATFGYSFSGTEISAEFVVRDNKTLADAAATRGFDHFNFVQLVTEYPGGILSGCLEDVSFLDPPSGGCTIPNIKADDLPFYYDEGDDWVGTEFYIGDRFLKGVDRSINELVDVGVTFDDQPFSPYASAESPMSFVLFPVGVYPDGTYETLVTEALFWTSDNNFFSGNVSVLNASRSNPIDDGLEETILYGGFVSFNELSPEQLALLKSTGFINTATVEAIIDINPGTLNLKSKGNWITTYIELPEGYSVEDIDVNSVILSKIDSSFLESLLYTDGPSEIGDYDENNIADLMVKFDRQGVISLLETTGDVVLTISGELLDGTTFDGTKTIKVIDKGKK